MTDSTLESRPGNRLIDGTLKIGKIASNVVIAAGGAYVTAYAVRHAVPNVIHTAHSFINPAVSYGTRINDLLKTSGEMIIGARTGKIAVNSLKKISNIVKGPKSSR